VTIGEISSLLSGEAGVATAIKQQRFRLIPGLTTLTQFGPAAAVLAGWLPRAEWPRVRRRFWVLLVLAATRSVLMSERLALIELLVPFGIAVACRHYRSGWRPRPRVALAPLIGLVVLMVGFTAFETTRSWGYYADDDQSLVAFGATRLEGYYVTAFNNAELNWRHRDELYPLPYNTLEFVWQAPLVSDVLAYPAITGVDPRDRYEELLTQEVNPEFANPGGLGVAFADWGLVGGSVVCALLGFVARRCFDSMSAGRELGELLYPLVALSLVELPRFWYITSGRLFPSIVALSLAALGGVDVKRRARYGA
ncbi:MAG: oligosaccharide repeat unit polymerase, partial [Actinobacteria bacterium]|nr:oligosaccharide repeat unit polymerase [Actinomycetota bacterium]